LLDTFFLLLRGPLESARLRKGHHDRLVLILCFFLASNGRLLFLGRFFGFLVVRLSAFLFEQIGFTNVIRKQASDGIRGGK
jgi:hypothetical protein